MGHVIRCQGVRGSERGWKCNHWGNYTQANVRHNKGGKSTQSISSPPCWRLLSSTVKIMVKSSLRAEDGRNSNDSHHSVCGSDNMSPLITCLRYQVNTISRPQFRLSWVRTEISVGMGWVSLGTHSCFCKYLLIRSLPLKSELWDIRHSHLLRGSHPSMATHWHMYICSLQDASIYKYKGLPTTKAWHSWQHVLTLITSTRMTLVSGSVTCRRLISEAQAALCQQGSVPPNFLHCWDGETDGNCE